jgi:hypothetical protein
MAEVPWTRLTPAEAAAWLDLAEPLAPASQ